MRLALAACLCVLAVSVNAQQDRVTRAKWEMPLPSCRIAAWCTATATLELTEPARVEPRAASQSALMELVDVRELTTVADRLTQQWTVRFLPLTSGAVELPVVTFAFRTSRGNHVVTLDPVLVSVSEYALPANATLDAPVPVRFNRWSARELLLILPLMLASAYGVRLAVRPVMRAYRRWARVRALRQARGALERAVRQQRNDHDSGQMMDALWNTIRASIDAELGLRSRAMTSSEVVGAVRGQADAISLDRLVRHADPARFGGRRLTVVEIEDALRQAHTFLLDLERRALARFESGNSR